MEHHLSGTHHHGKYIVIFVIIIVLFVVIDYLGYQQFMKWHEDKLRAVTAKQEQVMAKKNERLEVQINALQQQLNELNPPPVSSERLTQVFGKAEQETPMARQNTIASCDAMKSKITSFFNYLQKNSDSESTGKDPSAAFLQMVRALSANPPLVSDETRDIVSLKRNQAHFYRILKKDNLNMVKHFLMADHDVLEHAMADFFDYYIIGDCCKSDAEPCISINTIYEYAAFFMNTFSGKSYLFRQNSTLRCLTDYYSVSVLDKANDMELNRYGIDIRPYIDLSLSSISSHNNLLFRDQYINALKGLQKKYKR